MPKTFAFSNKGNYWKTRYSFLPCQYSTINKSLYSYPVTVNSAIDDTVPKSIPYLHQYGAEICRWYGTQSTSAVSFTFNDNVSTNKVFRSLSIEGTNNLTPTALLSVNNSRDPSQIKNTQAVRFNAKGGILYSGLSGSNQRTNKNVTTLGTIRSTDAVSYEGGRLILRLQMDWIRGAKAKIYNGITQTTGLYTVNYNDAGAITKFTFPSGVGSPASVANWQAGDSTIFNTAVGGLSTNFVGANQFLVAIDFNDIVEAGFLESLPTDISDASSILVSQAADTWGIGALGNGITLVALTPDDVNGAKPQGQYADLVVGLGTSDYEVFAFNAYYEPNTLDHSK